MPKSRWFAYAACMVAALVLMAGCATFTPQSPAVSAQASTAYRHAQSLYQSGDFNDAAKAFLALAGKYPALSNRAVLAAAASNRSLGKLDQTAALLQRVEPRQLTPNETARYHVLAAEVALHRGHPDAALRDLAKLPSPIPREIQQHALDAAARAQLARGNRVAAARELVQRTPLLPPPERTANQRRTMVVLAGIGKVQLTTLYHSLADSDPLKPWVQQALRHAGAELALALPHPIQSVGTIAPGATVPEGYAMPAQVALLLPATGPVAVAAKAVRDGFFTAYFHSQAGQAPRPSIRVYDTGGTPAGALAAYQQAVLHGAALVVGPLGRAAVEALFARPSLPVPVLALNHPQSQPPVPAGSAEFALLPEAEGAQLAAHMAEQGLHATIVFRGDGTTATRTFGAFQAEFASAGGVVADNVVLPRGAVDFEGQVKAALASSGPQTGIVALLRPVQARLLLAQLNLARSKLPVFSTSMLYSGAPNAIANGDLDGVVFCDAPWLYDAQAGLPNHTRLASILLSASGPAARLFAFGMDAYDLMPYLGWLRSHPGSYLPGATGELTVNAFGTVQRQPIWVRFNDGLAQPIAGGLDELPVAAPQSPVAAPPSPISAPPPGAQ